MGKVDTDHSWRFLRSNYSPVVVVAVAAADDDFVVIVVVLAVDRGRGERWKGVVGGRVALLIM